MLHVKPGRVIHAYTTSTDKVEAGTCEFLVSLTYIQYRKIPSPQQYELMEVRVELSSEQRKLMGGEKGQRRG